MKRALVTGGSGFVGANLTRRLLSEGHETHLILRPQHQSWRLAEIAGQFRLHAADLRDREGITRCVNEIRPDLVFHLAAYGAYPQQTGIDPMIATNLSGTAALVDACAALGMEAFVHAGSSSEYGYKDHAACEDEIIRPNSHYAITKAAATHYCQLTAAQRNLNAITLRLYSIYGAYEQPQRLIPALVIHGLRGGLPPLVSPHTARDFVYVDDAVDAILHIAAAGRPGAIYNVCTGVQSTLREVVEIARRVLDIRAEPAWTSMASRPWDTDMWIGSPDFTARETGWRPQVDLSAGLQQTVEWIAEHPSMREFYEAHFA